jgi:glycine/D-amino acid oxidase-like deaminating enzyme
MMQSKKEIVIIGAGAMGCSIAYHLAKQGVPSMIIDRDSIAARASGKSWAVWTYHQPNTAHRITKSKEDSEEDSPYTRAQEFAMHWRELHWMGSHRLPDIALELKEKGGVDIGYVELPRIRIALTESEEESARDRLSFLENEGYYDEGSWLSADDLRAIYPDINARARGGILAYSPLIEPYQYTLGLAQAAEKMGAEVLLREVVGFRHKGTKVTSVIFSSGSEIEADEFVIAMGVWNRQATSWLGKELPIIANQEECLRVRPPKRLQYGLSYAGLVVLPHANGTAIIGHSGLPDQRPDYDARLTEEVKTSLIERAISLLPMLGEAEIIEHRGDLMSWLSPPNETKPIVGRLPEWDNAYIAMPGPLGQMLSQGIGEVIANLIVAEGHVPDSIKHMMDYLSPARI